MKKKKMMKKKKRKKKKDENEEDQAPALMLDVYGLMLAANGTGFYLCDGSPALMLVASL